MHDTSKFYSQGFLEVWQGWRCQRDFERFECLKNFRFNTFEGYFQMWDAFEKKFRPL